MVLINIFLVNEDNVQNEPIEPFIDEDEQNAVVKVT